MCLCVVLVALQPFFFFVCGSASQSPARDWPLSPPAHCRDPLCRTPAFCAYLPARRHRPLLAALPELQQPTPRAPGASAPDDHCAAAAAALKARPRFSFPPSASPVADEAAPIQIPRTTPEEKRRQATTTKTTQQQQQRHLHQHPTSRHRSATHGTQARAERPRRWGRAASATVSSAPLTVSAANTDSHAAHRDRTAAPCSPAKHERS